MGHRTLKRVPMNFDWPLDTVWKGYLNPFRGPSQCRACEGTGLNVETRRIEQEFHDHDGYGKRWKYTTHIVGLDGRRLIQGDCRAWCHEITPDEVQALLDAGYLWDFTRVPRNAKQEQEVRKKIAGGGNCWLPYDNGYVPTADEVNAWSRKGMGHDCGARAVLIEARAKRLGVYGQCDRCHGRGETKPSKRTRKKYEGWKEYEPPKGDGYQLWETCSEGSPMSPVFATPEELADWCADKATIFGSIKTSRNKWLEMFTGRKSPEVESMYIIDTSTGYVGARANEPR